MQLKCPQQELQEDRQQLRFKMHRVKLNDWARGEGEGERKELLLLLLLLVGHPKISVPITWPIYQRQCIAMQ